MDSRNQAEALDDQNLVSTLTATDDVFTLENSDPRQESILEPRQDAKTFPRFQELPLELRWKVWRHTFPYGRDTTLNVVYRGELPERVRKRGSLPIGLQINRESRKKTLKHYCVFYQLSEIYDVEAVETCDDEDVPALRRPLTFNPSQDNFSISVQELFPWYYLESPMPLQTGWPQYTYLKPHLSALRSQFPVHMGRIRELKITNYFFWDWHNGGSNSGMIDLSKPWNNASQPLEATRQYHEFIFYFKGLRQLILECPSRKYAQLAHMARPIRNRGLEKFLEENKHMFQDGEAPKVHIVPEGSAQTS